MLEKENIQRRGFRNVYRDGKLVGFQIAYRSGYYRGIWLSMSTGFDVTVDGEKFPRESITVTIEGKTYMQEQMKKLGNVHWPNYAPAILTVAKPGGLKLGVHEVEITWGHRTSYFPPGGARPVEPRPQAVIGGMGIGTAARKLVLVR